MIDQKPTADELAGMVWWGELAEDRRAYWLSEANIAIVAEAWAEYKRVAPPQPESKPSAAEKA